MITMPRSMGAVREWLRAQPEITALVPLQRMYFRLPEKDLPGVPCLLLYRVAGVSDWHGKDYPEVVIVGFAQNYGAAEQLMQVVSGCINDFYYRDVFSTTFGYIEGIDIGSGAVPMEPQPDWAKRWSISATFTIRAV